MSRSAILIAMFFLGLPSSVFAPEMRPAITGLYSVKIRASEMDKSRQFYGERLKLPRAGNCLASPSDCFMLGPFQRIEIIQNSASSPSTINTLAFSTGSARTLRTYLLSRGLRPAKLISSDPCGMQEFFEIVDPDQHHLVFVTNSWGVAGSVQSAQLSDRMIHSGFVVRDRAAEEHFYKDILGFRPYWRGGKEDDQTDWVSLQVPDGTDWVEFMVNVSPNADHHTLGVMNHIALGVTDIHAAQQQLIKNRWNPTEEPKIGRGGKWQLNVYDPDGTRIEFMEFKPVQKPCCSEYTGPHPGPQQ